MICSCSCCKLSSVEYNLVRGTPESAAYSGTSGITRRTDRWAVSGAWLLPCWQSPAAAVAAVAGGDGVAAAAMPLFVAWLNSIEPSGRGLQAVAPGFAPEAAAQVAGPHGCYCHH